MLRNIVDILFIRSSSNWEFYEFYVVFWALKAKPVWTDSDPPSADPESFLTHGEHKAEGDALPDAKEEPGFRHVPTTDGQECGKSPFFNTDSHSQCILVQLVPLSHWLTGIETADGMNAKNSGGQHCPTKTRAAKHTVCMKSELSLEERRWTIIFPTLLRINKNMHSQNWILYLWSQSYKFLLISVNHQTATKVRRDV